MTEQIHRVAVWSGWLRLAHWALAGSTVLLLVTGWLVAHSPVLGPAAADLHYLGAAFLLFALALRIFLGVFGRGVERFGQLLPRPSEWRAMRDSLVFYLSLGRTRQPNWYAHNPLWKPLYLLLFVVLGGQVLSGWVMPDMPMVGRLYLPRLHAWLSDIVAVMILAHLFSAVLQDLKGRHADVSGMINGERYFDIEREGLVRPEVPEVSIRLEDFGRPRRKG